MVQRTVGNFLHSAHRLIEPICGGIDVSVTPVAISTTLGVGAADVPTEREATGALVRRVLAGVVAGGDRALGGGISTTSSDVVSVS